MFEEKYRRELSGMGPAEEQVNQVMERLRQARTGNRWGRVRRGALAAAALCGVLVVTAAAAALLGAFDFLWEQDEYAMLGRNEVFEHYAQPVDAAATADNGDVLIIDRMAMDGSFCTVFYSVQFHEPVLRPAELEQWRSDDVPDLWQTYEWTPDLALYAGGEEVSEEGYNNSFEPQVYLADANTLYGAWQVLLTRPLAEGEALELRAAAYGPLPADSAGKEAGWEKKWDLAVPLTAHPAASERFTPDVTFQSPIQGTPYQIQVLSLERSPLGTLLRLREEQIPNYFGLEFVLRDGDTGDYIPFAEVFTSHLGDPEGYEDRTFELYGDRSGLKNLELIPVRGLGSTSPRQAVSIADLPEAVPANPDGGYTPASYAVEDGRLIVTMEPLGAVTGQYPRLANGVYFLDADGNQLFEDVSVQKFKNRSDGTITVISTPSEASFRTDADKVRQIWYFVQRYELLPGQTVTIPLS